ncbi:MAG: metallophosphoesterase, partial [Desulfobacterales bacterium]
GMARLIIFLTIFFSLYGGLHLYALIKIKRSLGLGSGPTIALSIFMVFMVLAPVIVVRMPEWPEFALFTRVMAYFGYTWMGLLFIFVSIAFALDICHLFLQLGGIILQRELPSITVSSRYSFIIVFLCSLVITGYGAFEAVSIRLEHITIKTDKIPKTVNRFRIAQISDVHLGLIVGVRRLDRIIYQIAAAKPDILISTGDLVDGQMDDSSRFADMLRKIDTRHGKFAVTGNHEFYAELPRSLEFIKKAGFRMLRSENVIVSDWLNIVGVDDPTGKRYSVNTNESEKALLSKFSRDKFTLLMKHRPIVDNDATGLFDLQLSGHTHKGQIFPFSLITKLFYPADAGLFFLEKNASLYVSRGTGTWGPPIRFLAAPEVTLIELVPDN